jgi:hypothetical protein
MKATVVAVLACLLAGCAHVTGTPSVASVMQADRDFAARARSAGLRAAFVEYAAPDAILFRDGVGPIRGSAAIGESFAGADGVTLTWAPEEAHMPLLYVPYAVCRNEGFILSNRRILADQMTFLQASLPKYSRWAHA